MAVAAGAGLLLQAAQEGARARVGAGVGIPACRRVKACGSSWHVVPRLWLQGPPRTPTPLLPLPLLLLLRLLLRRGGDCRSGRIPRLSLPCLLLLLLVVAVGGGTGLTRALARERRTRMDVRG